MEIFRPMLIEEDHIAINSHTTINILCKQLIANTIFDTFKYTRVYADGRYIYLSNHKQWTKYYLQNELFNVGMFEQPGCTIGGCKYFLWRNIDDFIFQKGKEFNILNGLSIVKEAPDHIEIYHFGSYINDGWFNNYAINHLFLLETFCNHFKEKAKDLIASFHPEIIFLNKSIESSDKLLFPFMDGSIQNTIQQPLLHITPREKACLRLLSTGMTAKEISKELAISARTVETYLSNAKERLSCKNIAHLLTVCIYHHLL